MTEDAIRERLIAYLRSCPKATVWTEELERLFQGEPITYTAFGQALLALEREQYVSEVKAAGRRTKQPSLANRYRLNHALLKADKVQLLHKYRLELHPLISLDAYFAQPEAVWERELPYLKRIHHFLQEFGLPTIPAPAPERSFQLVGDEKWITDKGGKAVLERIGLWSRLLIDYTGDPLMLAVNAGLLATESTRFAVNAQPDSDGAKANGRPRAADSNLAGRPPCLHLIVENKATFHGLLPALPESGFHTLIYGCGNKIVGNLDQLAAQVPLPMREHRFYYFGDLDHAGLQIWYRLSLHYPVIPALAFYHACLHTPPVEGKQNQRQDDAALKAFLARLPDSADREKLAAALQAGRYYPQETLPAEQLRQIWRNTSWAWTEPPR